MCRWLVLDICGPSLFCPHRRLILSSFDNENPRTMAAVRKYAETHSGANVSREAIKGQSAVPKITTAGRVLVPVADEDQAVNFHGHQLMIIQAR